MDQLKAIAPESEPVGNSAQERRAHEREALRERVRESLLRCPEGEPPPRS